MKTKILCIVVNYKTSSLTINSIRSLAKENSDEIQLLVIVVDNDSKDGSIDDITNAIYKNGWHDWVSILPLDANRGFSFGNNSALRKTKETSVIPNFVWFLNPDTIVRPGGCKALVEFLITHPLVGVVGSRLEGLDGIPQTSAFRFPTIISEMLSGLQLGLLSNIFSRWLVAPTVIPKSSKKTDWVSGASMMVRREVLEEIGFMDERFFLYFEEVDFCLRSKKEGWESWYVPASRVVHFESVSTGITDPQKKPRRRPPYWFESRRLFFLKNYGNFTLIIADLTWIICRIFWTFRYRKKNRHKNGPPYFLQDFFRHSVFCKGTRI